MKIYDLVLKLLKTKPETRNDDDILIVEVWRYRGLIKRVQWFGEREAILVDNLRSLLKTESIRRSRQKVCELHPELEATDPKVRAARHLKELTKGNWIFSEIVQGRLL